MVVGCWWQVEQGQTSVVGTKAPLERRFEEEALLTRSAQQGEKATKKLPAQIKREKDQQPATQGAEVNGVLVGLGDWIATRMSGRGKVESVAPGVVGYSLAIH